MGLLDAGTPMAWDEAQQHAEHVRRNGIEQFINIYRHYEHVEKTPFLWGDEVEFFVTELDEQKRTARLPVRTPEILAALKKDQDDGHDIDDAFGAVWHPEFANWMIEATPAVPYGKSGSDIAKVERNMWLRRMELSKHLRANEKILSLPVFPRLGAAGFTADPALAPAPNGPTSRSLYIPDESIQPHPRFPTLTANIRKRRGEKVQIKVPVYQDKHTATALQRQAAEILKSDPEHGHEIVEQLGANIYMDAMAFGMGAGCLQVTLQASDVHQARTLYDQLAVISPIMLALSAASPIWKGMLADTDARWNVISASVDDRSAHERGQAAATRDGEQRIYKSRYSSIDCFISQSPLNRAELSDVPVPVNDRAMQRLMEAGIDSKLSRHVAHLFVRDPLVVYQEKLHQDNVNDNDHFENLQSTNWNTMRFKPPPSAAKNPHGIKWRVEFRPMEVSLTDFENAAFSAFMILLARAISEQDLDFYMPISKVDANMETAHRRNAATGERFWFRTHTTSTGAHSSLDQLTVGEIINGSAEKGVVGLLQRVRTVLDNEGCGGEERAQLEQYFSFIGQRASGQLKTTALWMREQMLAHADYRGDSLISEAMCHDLMVRCAAVASGTLAAPELVPTFLSSATAATLTMSTAANSASHACLCSHVASPLQQLQHSNSTSSISTMCTTLSEISIDDSMEFEAAPPDHPDSLASCCMRTGICPRKDNRRQEWMCDNMMGSQSYSTASLIADLMGH